MTAAKQITHSHYHGHSDPVAHGHGHWHDHGKERDEHDAHEHSIKDAFPHSGKTMEPIRETVAAGIESITPKYQASKSRRPVLTKEWKEKYG